MDSQGWGLRESYLDFRPAFSAVPRCFGARPAFRTGFLAAAVAVFVAAVLLVALRVLVLAAFVFVDSPSCQAYLGTGG